MDARRAERNASPSHGRTLPLGLDPVRGPPPRRASWAFGVRGAARRQPHHEPRSAAVERGLEADGAVVGLRDRADDREAEAARSAAVARAAEEALEDLVAQVLRDTRAVVLDREHDGAVDALHLRLDR